MGKLVGGPFGQMSGKTGDLIGSSWKGIATVKRYQPKVANPQTAGQVAQRGKMANIVAFAQVILAGIIKPLWDRFQSGQSGFNAFVSRNISLFVSALPSDFGNLVISSGKMAATSILGVTSASGDSDVTITWVNDSGQGFKLATDKAYVVIISEGTGAVKGFATGVARSAGTLTVALDDSLMPGDTLHCYLAFLRADGTVVSVNSYFEEAVV